ncbi:sensor histidine kinase [Jidongwangia harbinensis]|uniref:sensor histidine kinase n=1 Tax=Jidongwangia harbinensis TaxID=2878561 RepID=UPI001CD92C90|nr:histidine kinase [Jidongwangia harbinensis]MCA2211696.1 histidine kinase [Jidongwangia harbinensis]
MRRVLVDAAVLSLLVAAAVTGGLITAHIAGSGALVWAIVGIQLLTSVAILGRRRWPVGTGVLAALSALVQALIAFAGPPGVAESLLSVSAWVPLMLSVSVDTIVERGVPARRTAWVWILIGVLTVVSMRPWDPTIGLVVNGLLHSAVAPLFGLYLAARRRKLQLLEERAERARGEERTRLAAELHDLVAHRVTLMTLQAGALSVSAPDAATRQAAEEVRDNGARALDELRELVGVLRRDGRAAAPALHEPPAPALADLVDDAVRVGQAVRLTVDGAPSPEMSGVTGRTAYRVVQEALTNARKHAAGAPVRVDAVYRAGEVRIVVRNTRPRGRSALAATGAGTGLTGLRERVESIGGWLRAGPEEGGGFRIETVLPVRG